MFILSYIMIIYALTIDEFLGKPKYTAEKLFQLFLEQNCTLLKKMKKLFNLILNFFKRVALKSEKTLVLECHEINLLKEYSEWKPIFKL